MRELGLLNEAYFEIGVTLAERHLLIELSSAECPTMGEIAERLLLDKSTASRLIGKAIKKGYIQWSADSKDKRKKYIHLTELGRQTLQAFEPIAFHQTEAALLTLTPEERERVFQGIALYAKGLKASRLANKQSELQIQEIQGKRIHLEKINAQWADQGLCLKPFSQEAEEALYEIFKEVVDAGTQFPYECNSKQEFHRQFFGPKSEVYVAHSINGEVLGGFYLKPNFSGRSAHIANAAYMVKGSCRGQGIGTLLIKASLEIAKQLGFRAMQFNMVLSQNQRAVKLYEKLGFKIVGRIPNAVRVSDGRYQEGYILYIEWEGNL